MSKLRFTNMLRMLVAEINPSSEAHYSREFDYIVSNDLDIIDSAFTAMDTRVTAVEETLTNHETRVATLEAWKTDVDDELEQHANRIAVIENVISTVSTQNVEDLMERVTALESKVTTNASQINELNLNINDINTRLAADEVAINTNKGNIEGAISRITILENCCSEVRETLSAYDIRITKNTDDISGILARLTRDENNIQGNAEDISALSVQVQTNAENIEDLTEALNQLDPTSTIGLVRQVTTNTENISNLQSITASHTSTLDSMVVRFTNDEVRITDLERRMTDAEDALEQVQDWQSEIDSLSATVSDMVDVQFPALTTTVNGFESRIATLEECCEDMQEYVTSNDARVLAVEARVTTAEGNITTLANRVTSVENGVSSLDTDLSVVENDVESLTTRVTTLESSVGSSDISTYGNDITSAILTLGGRIANNASSISDLTTRVNDLETNKASITYVDTQVSALESAIGETDAHLLEVENSIGDLSELETTEQSSIVGAINEINEGEKEKWLNITDYLTFTSSQTITGSSPQLWLSNKGDIIYNGTGSMSVNASSYARNDIYNITTSQPSELYSAIETFSPQLLEYLAIATHAHAERTSYAGSTTNGEMVTTFFDVTNTNVSSGELTIIGKAISRMHTLNGNGYGILTCGDTIVAHLVP